MSDRVDSQSNSGRVAGVDGNSTPTNSEIFGTAYNLASQRSVLWGVFGEVLTYPDEELLTIISSGALAEQLQDLLKGMDSSICDSVDWIALRETVFDGRDLVTEFTRLFDGGAGGPKSCSLHGGAQHGPRMQAMEEAVRFYNYFGMNMSEDAKETPDHLSVELEFMHFLSYAEAELISRGENTEAYARARRDFIARHLGRWIPVALRQLEQLDPPRFYLEIFRLLDRCLQSDLDGLQQKYGQASLVPPPVMRH